jgi:hypothetical protein
MLLAYTIDNTMQQDIFRPSTMTEDDIYSKWLHSQEHPRDTIQKKKLNHFPYISSSGAQDRKIIN